MNVRMIVRLVVALAVGAFTGSRGYDAAAQSTPTPTPQPVVAIGSSSGPPSSQVTIAISLTNNGANIVTVAPLVFTFDPTVLTFGSCNRAAGVSSGTVRLSVGTESVDDLIWDLEQGFAHVAATLAEKVATT